MGLEVTKGGGHYKREEGSDRKNSYVEEETKNTEGNGKEKGEGELLKFKDGVLSTEKKLEKIKERREGHQRRGGPETD